MPQSASPARPPFRTIFHLVQEELWARAVAEQSTYYPPTYEQDGFTHGTANPARLLQVANHFYTEIPGTWQCLEMSIDSLAATCVEVVFEGTAPVGDTPADFAGSDEELFPHLQGGIHPKAVVAAHVVERDESGKFLAIPQLGV